MPLKTAYQGAWNFLGLPPERSDPEHSPAWILPIPYESTTSYGAGTRDGPAAIIAASRQVEKYDRQFNCVPVDRFGVHTLNPIGPIHRSPEAMQRTVSDAVHEILTGHPAPKILGILGGEHSLAAGTVQGIVRAGIRPLVSVQIDAHADLRGVYEGSTLSHACAARHIAEVCPLFQIGIRNIAQDEVDYIRKNRRVHTVFAEGRNPQKYLKELARFVRGKQVYMTIDVDGLDPSIMPSTGTPEPGGLSWEETLQIVEVVCLESAALPVFDVVELAPVSGFRGPDFLVAKLIYKILSLSLLGRSQRR